MKTVDVKIDQVTLLTGLPSGRVNLSKLDATTEKDIAQHKEKDNIEAMYDAAKFARRVRCQHHM